MQSLYHRGGRTDMMGHKRMRSPNQLVYIVAVILFMGVILTLLNIYELHKMKEDHGSLHHNLNIPEGWDAKAGPRQPIVWVQGKKTESGYLKHVFRVFELVGYEVGDENADWDVLWAHDYPFGTYAKQMTNLKPYQKVNHFPGSGFITNKASLASTKMKFIPKAFRVPADKNKFLSYTEEHPDTMWVQKSNNHRGIEIKSVKELDLRKDGTFVQEYVDRPFLIDKRKFDIGIYTIMTSINPLRLYIIDGDALFRFCVKEYYPFDYRVVEKYVVKDDYTPMWELPSLKTLFDEMNYSYKDTFNAYLKSKGLNYQKVWDDMKAAILTVYLEKEPKIIESSRKYKTTKNFFEMVRFDFVLDEDLNVYLMEANMSPNLSSLHFARNSRLYEHVVFNLLSLVGIVRRTGNGFYTSGDDELQMQVSDTDIQVYPEVCNSYPCQDHCEQLKCKLCNKCLTTEFRTHLKLAYLEHIQRGSCRRVFPKPLNHTEASKFDPDVMYPYSQANSLMSMWFEAKCHRDPAFCT